MVLRMACFAVLCWKSRKWKLASVRLSQLTPRAHPLAKAAWSRTRYGSTRDSVKMKPE